MLSSAVQVGPVAAGSRDNYAFSKADNIASQSNVIPGQANDPVLFKYNGKYPRVSDTTALSAVSKQILTDQDVRAGVQSVLYGGQGLAVKRTRNDNMYYPTDLLLLYRVKSITYKRLLGGKGLFNLTYNGSTPVVLLYKPLVDGSGGIYFNSRIRFLPSTDPKTGLWQYVEELLDATGLKSYKYNLVVNGQKDGWIANESMRATLHALCLLKSNPTEGILTTDTVYQEWLACNSFNDKLYSKEMAKSGYNLPKRKRFRLNVCKANMPVAINPAGNGSDLGGLLSANPINTICGPTSFITDSRAKADLCNSITYDGKGPEGTSMFYYPGANNGGRDQSNCAAGTAWRYALAMDRLPTVCNAYGFEPKLTYFSFCHIQFGGNPVINYMKSDSYNSTVALSDTTGNSMAYLNFSILLPSGTFSDVYKLSDITSIITLSKGTIIVRIELNDTVLTGDLSNTNRPLLSLIHI